MPERLAFAANWQDSVACPGLLTGGRKENNLKGSDKRSNWKSIHCRQFGEVYRARCLALF
jgi:hypothetical protein